NRYVIQIRPSGFGVAGSQTISTFISGVAPWTTPTNVRSAQAAARKNLDMPSGLQPLCPHAALRWPTGTYGRPRRCPCPGLSTFSTRARPANGRLATRAVVAQSLPRRFRRHLVRRAFLPPATFRLSRRDDGYPKPRALRGYGAAPLRHHDDRRPAR